MQNEIRKRSLFCRFFQSPAAVETSGGNLVDELLLEQRVYGGGGSVSSSRSVVEVRLQTARFTNSAAGNGSAGQQWRTSPSERTTDETMKTEKAAPGK